MSTPIRSPGRQRVQQQATVYRMQPNTAADDVGSIPENPDDRDIAVLFDSDPDAVADANNRFLKREVSMGIEVLEIRLIFPQCSTNLFFFRP